MFLSGNSTGTKKKGLAAYSAVRGGHLLDEGVAYFISLPILEGATDNFSKRAGKGSFGSVYCGRMKDGKEVAQDSAKGLKLHFKNIVLCGYVMNLLDR